MAARQLALCGWCEKPLENPLNGDATHIDHVNPILNPACSNSKNGAVRRSHYTSRAAFQKHGDGLRLVHAACNLERGDSEDLKEVPF